MAPVTSVGGKVGKYLGSMSVENGGKRVTMANFMVNRIIILCRLKTKKEQNMMVKYYLFYLASLILFLNSNGCSPNPDSQALPENQVSKHIEQRLKGTPVRHLLSIDILQHQFRADSGNVRIISILSPT